ncbi:adenylate/guanylate cyclase domain-containing protein [Terrarubrum flagellatum]|uniref:adenylate/guanylate cyclase domain-containing protein n=1 Tax=Terrirubrum flagellatum TaxID=2895980 RepID=UPI0031451C20
MKRKIAAILAADIAGYSRLVAEDEEETLARLESWRAVFDDFVNRSGGRIFNTAGDSVLAEFSSAVDATRCAIDIQESMRTRNLVFPQNRRMEFRIGITIGDVVERDGDLLGDGVNVAARLEGLAEPGGICVSRGVYEAVANKLSVPFLDIGQQEVKNIPQPVHAFRVEWRNGGRKPLRRQQPSLLKRWSHAFTSAAAATGIAAIAAGAGYWLMKQAPEPPIALAPERPADHALTTQPSTAAPPVVVATPTQPPTPSQPQPPAVPEKQPLPTDFSEALAVLQKQGGIVQNASTAPELYHNARSYEMRGDALAARQAYLAFARLDLNLLDPLMRFAALLRVQEGRAGAREVFAALADQNRSPAFALVHALQFDGPERTRRLQTFITANPDFAPASALLAEDYSDNRIGATQTIADMRKEQDALQRFLDSDGEGKLQPYFLDHSVAGAWLDRARKRLAALDTSLAHSMQQPNVNFMRHNTGWNVNVQLPEAASSFAWRIGDSGDFHMTASTGAIDPRTGRPAPVTWFELPPDIETATLEVRYADASGRVNGPYPIQFEWRKALVDSQKQILQQFTSAWIQFARDSGSDTLYFTHLISYRCAIAKAEIGFDNEAPNRALPMPPCDRRDPNSIPYNAKTTFNAPPAAKSASVRLTYVDGSTSSVATFKR